jgi:DNA mismatch repair protein MutS2
VDLEGESAAALDWHDVLAALAGEARTPGGAAAARVLEPQSRLERVQTVLDAVEEAERLRCLDAGRVPVSGIEPVQPLLDAASRGEVLEQGDLYDVSATVGALVHLKTFLESNRDDAPTIAKWSEAIEVDPALAEMLLRAFDAQGRLSGQAYPQLAELRRRISALEKRIRDELDAMLAAGEFSDLLQDRYVTMRGDRFVVPVKAHAKNLEIGIVHDSSRTGQTVYVEPRKIVPLGNEKRVAEAQLAAEERRILAELSAAVAGDAEPLARALVTAVEIDLFDARAAFARRLKAVRPKVGNTGVVDLREARHPILALAGGDIVANDLRLDGKRSALVLTGPNAGGKTVALKTVGVCAMLVRIGCLVPAAAGSRVDLFDEVLADIGDRQTVHEGLSSFSGHLKRIKAMLDRARPGALFLLDELASGTDPAQGGALARSLVERLTERGARMVVTTHYAQVKAMPAAHPRVAVAAMEYREGRPPYRLVPGMAGESHALSAAAAAGFDERILERARALMDVAERALEEALASLEAERLKSARVAQKAEDAVRAVEAKQALLERKEAKLLRRAREIEEAGASEFLSKLAETEKEIVALVAELQRAPESKGAGEAKRRVEEIAARTREEQARLRRDPEDAGERPELAVGDSVRVEKFGTVGRIASLRGDEVEVTAGTMTFRVPASEVVRVGGSASGATGPAVAPSRPGGTPAGKPAARPAMRMPTNTLDLRGARVVEGLERMEKFLDDAVLRGEDAVFVLHGHGTGVLKTAVRQALENSPYVAESGPAESDQGGDAFTVATLRG